MIILIITIIFFQATDLFKTYVTGVIENSSKMEVFVEIVTESIKLGDRLLVFSQSLLTLDLIEDYFQRRNVPDKEEVWTKNKNYFRKYFVLVIFDNIYLCG